MFLLFSLFSPIGLDFYVDEYVFNIQFNFILLFELVYKSGFSRETEPIGTIYIYICVCIYTHTYIYIYL